MKKIPEILFVDPQTSVNIFTPNVGLAYAASYFNTRVIDQHILPYPKNRFLNSPADTLGISVKSFTYTEAKHIDMLYRKKYPYSKVKTISGFLDVQCCYPYLSFGEEIAFNEPFGDNYPFPKYELFDSYKYLIANWRIGFWNYPLITSHGCPFGCIFCVSRNRKWQARSAENCYEELKLAKYKYKIKSFEILDDCFNVDKERVIKFCELVRSLKLKWFCTNGLRADRFDEEIAEALSSSGCEFINFGIESVDPEVLLKIKKGETIQQIEEAVDIAKKYFHIVNGFFIIGLPGSDYKKDLLSLKWVREKNIYAHFSYYVPFDKGIQFNAVFYGEGARPYSDAYSLHLQKKLYSLTRYMAMQKLIKRNLFLKLFMSTGNTFLSAHLPSILTHISVGAKKMLRVILKGEL